jgi:hypothetical protein
MSKDLEVLKADVKKLMLKDWTKTEVEKLSEFMEDVIIATMLVNKLPIHVVVGQSELLKHDNLKVGSQVEIDLTFTEKHIGKIVSIDNEKVKVENNDWTYEVSKQNISKVF